MPPEIKALYEFGKFRCDPRDHLLLYEGKQVSLAPKAFEILVALIQSGGRLLTKDELMRQVWPDSFVEEANLTVNISALRKALGEISGGQQHIETVPKRGYRFIAPVIEYQEGPTPDPPVQTYRVELGLSAATSASPVRVRPWWVAAGIVLAAVIVSLVVMSRRQVRLTDRDSVVLADFANSTGDPVFDDALRQGLSSQLEQSPFLNLLSDERIAQTLSLMAQPKDTRLTHRVAREVCQRTASAAVLDGTIAQVGTQYLLTLKAENCSNGDSLGSAQAQAADKNHVLDALGKVASQIRGRLGESLASVQKYDAPADNVTTPSLEALKAYSLGYQAMVVKSDYTGAIPLFQQAINLDPNFAMAYARMGTSLSNLSESTRAVDSVRKAYELQGRASERERLYIASHYQIIGTGNLDAARKVYELSAQTYPRDTPYTNLGLIYSELGDHDKAIAAYKNGISINSGTGSRYANLIIGYLHLDRLEDARATAQEAQAHNVDSPRIHLGLYSVAFLQHDAAGMEREAAELMGHPGYEDQMLNVEADTALYGGQLVKARALTHRAVESARRMDQKEAAALYLSDAAVREALVNNSNLAKLQARSALAISHSSDVEGVAAVALAMAGDPDAMQLADDLAKRFPENTFVQFSYLPTIRGAVFLRQGNEGKALTALAAVTPHELASNETLSFVLYPVYLRGEAYLEAKQGSAAAAEFQKIVDHPGIVRSEPIGALAQLQLGRAHALAGDPDKARSFYQDFLALWKDADQDIPILKQAKAELAKLP